MVIEWTGQYAPAEEMLRDVRGHTAAHSYLFVGPAGTGKRTLAGLCSQALACSAAHAPCGICPSCKRAMSGNHPDIIRVNEQKKIGVDIVRDLIDKLSSRSYEGGYRSIIIHDADTMTAQAQNALLKTLEEPPDSVVFFLLVEKASPLLPTIISRCRVMRFRLMRVEDAQSTLVKRGVEPERAALLARMTDGSVGKALEIDKNEAYWALRQRVSGAISRLKTKQDVGAAAQLLKDDRENAAAIMEIMESWAGGLLIERETGQKALLLDMPALHNTKTQSGADMLQSIMTARKRLNSNVSWQSVIEMLFFDFLAV